MNRASIAGAAGLYASMLPQIIEIGKLCGYAIAVHGTASHDFDLIAIPWVHNALPGSELVRRIAAQFGGYIQREGEAAQAHSPEIKTHGRIGWSIFFNPAFIGPYIDVSVTPRIDYKTKTVIEDEEAT